MQINLLRPQIRWRRQIQSGAAEGKVQVQTEVDTSKRVLPAVDTDAGHYLLMIQIKVADKLTSAEQTTDTNQ